MLGLGLAPAEQGEEQCLVMGQARDRQQDGQQTSWGGGGDDMGHVLWLDLSMWVRDREKSPCV